MPKNRIPQSAATTSSVEVRTARNGRCNSPGITTGDTALTTKGARRALRRGRFRSFSSEAHTAHTYGNAKPLTHFSGLAGPIQLRDRAHPNIPESGHADYPISGKNREFITLLRNELPRCAAIVLCLLTATGLPLHWLLLLLEAIR